MDVVQGVRDDSGKREWVRMDMQQRMAEALEKLAASDAFSEISDPVEWQREIRKDRPLPGRDG